jgi:predicted DNA-binding transcriptional regulator YafY
VRAAQVSKPERVYRMARCGLDTAGGTSRLDLRWRLSQWFVRYFRNDVIMRADRLLSILMLLQSRGPRKLTAQELARELEVSERTIYRDIDALSASGVPIYAEPGPGGGYALLDSYRTTLTGLNEGEARALFMLSIPDALADLGLSQQLRSALLKLGAALPAARREDQDLVRQRFYLDSSWWRQGEEPVPHLSALHEAVWRDQRVALAYRIEPLGIDITQMVDPYALVAKAGVWYLVVAVQGPLRVFQLSGLSQVRLTGEAFQRPDSFDLEAFWRGWCREQERSHDRYAATVRVAPQFAPELIRRMGEQARRGISAASAVDAVAWLTVELHFESLEAARERILSFGGGVEVLEPLALRWSVQDFAQQVMAVYGRPGG